VRSNAHHDEIRTFTRSEETGNQLKNTLIKHPPESDITLDLMSEAADLLVSDRLKDAAEKTLEADIQSLGDWFHFEAQASTKVLQQHGIVPSTPPRELKTKTTHKQRDFYTILERDGWHCRFCSTRVIDPRARRRFSLLLPDAMRWGSTNLSKHACLAVLASPDHVLPRGWGGSNDLDNLVTACWPCQFSRMEVRIEECGISDPRDRAPIKNQWDGLLRVLEVDP